VTKFRAVTAAVMEGMKSLMGGFVEDELVPVSAKRLERFAKEAGLESVWAGVWGKMEEKVTVMLREGGERGVESLMGTKLRPR